MMSHRDVGPEPETAGGHEIDRAISALRASVPVRAEWRAEVLRSIASLGSPASAVEHVRRWSVRPVTAIAAGIACALVGATLATLLVGRAPHAPPADVLGSLTATMPLPGENAVEAPDRSAVRFVFVAPYASRVSLVGDFNGWNPTSMPMRRSPDGRSWLLDVLLAPGRHVYSFIVDGDLAPDPAAPRAGDDDFGVPSSVVLVARKT